MDVESLIKWRDPNKETIKTNLDFIAIDNMGIISSNMVRPNTVAFAYRSDIRHYPEDKREVKVAEAKT